MSGLSEGMVCLLLWGQTALWPLTTRARLKAPLAWVSSADEVVPMIGQVDYLAPHGFVARSRTKVSASPQGNLLWLDLDPPKGLSEQERPGWLAAHVARVRELLPLYSVRLDSGRGQWLFWKLAGHLSKAEIDRLNRLLSRLSGSSDPGSWGCQGWVRMPGSRNEKTGVVATCVEIHEQRHEPGILAAAIDEAAVAMGINLAPAIDGGIDTAPLATGSVVPEIALPDRLRTYIDQAPTQKQAEAMGIDRSSLDQALVARLVNAGSSDEGVKAWFEHHQPSKYADEVARGYGDYHLRRCIRVARDGLKRFSQSVCIRGDDPYSDPAPVRRYIRAEPEQVLAVVRKHPGKPKKQAEAEICKALGCSPSTGKRRLDQLAKGKRPFVEFRAIDGRTKAVYVTDRGEAFFKPGKTKFQTSLPVGFLRANPSRRDKPKKPSTEEPAKASQPRDPAKPVTKETLLKRITNQLRYHQVEDMPRFSWRGQKRSFYVQILDYIEVIEMGRRVYDQIMLPGDHHVGDLTYHRFRTFISYDWHDEDGRQIPDPLQRIDPEVYRPRSRILATAVIVEPKDNSFEVTTWDILDERTGEWITKPAVGWIIEDMTFWEAILDDPKTYNDRVFKTVRHGKGATRRFIHTPTEVSLCLDHLRDLIDREAYLKKWADRDQLRAVAASLPPGWKPYPTSTWGH
jgi:DNA-binding MarR family transcriptional regulator